jgi:hypothetical protein
LLWDLTFKVASTPKATIVVDLVEIVGCYIVKMLILSKWIFAFFLVMDFKALMDLKFSFSFDGHDLQFKLWNSQIELP